MSIVRIRLLAVAALALFLGAPAAAEAGASKEFKAHNFKWTLPDEWEFKDVPAAAREGGHVIQALSPSGDVRAMVYASKTDLPAEERAAELKNHLAGFLDGKVKRKKIVESTLSGIDCHVVVGEGKYRSGSLGHVRLYVMGHGGKLYHLEVRTYNDAHVDRRDELNALRKGFRLLNGADDEDDDEAFDEFPASEGDDDDEAEADDDDDWPAKGPKREGDKLVFTGLNVTWSLKGLPLQWDKPIMDMKDAYSIDDKNRVSWKTLVQCFGKIERKKQEFEKDTPDHNRAQGWFAATMLPFGVDSSKRLRSSELQEGLQREFGLGEIKSSSTRVRDDVQIGNLAKKSYMLKIEAPLRNGEMATLLHFEAQLKGMLYMWKFLLRGHSDRYKQWVRIIGPSMKTNVSFPEPIDNVAGPIVPPDGINTFSGTRGVFVKKRKRGKTLFAPGGVEFTLPHGVYDLKAANKGNPDIRWAVEWRSKDGQVYVYFDLHTWPAAMLQRKQMSLDTKAQKHISEWEAGAGEDVRMSKKGKPPFLRKGGSLLRFKGDWSYEFHARRGDVPYMEEGIWSKEGTFVIWARVQYGGVGAEKHKGVKKIISAIKKGISLK